MGGPVCTTDCVTRGSANEFLPKATLVVVVDGFICVSGAVFWQCYVHRSIRPFGLICWCVPLGGCSQQCRSKKGK